MHGGAERVDPDVGQLVVGEDAESELDRRLQEFGHDSPLDVLRQRALHAVSRLLQHQLPTLKLPRQERRSR